MCTSFNTFPSESYTVPAESTHTTVPSSRHGLRISRLLINSESWRGPFPFLCPQQYPLHSAGSQHRLHISPPHGIIIGHWVPSYQAPLLDTTALTTPRAPNTRRLISAAGTFIIRAASSRNLLSCRQHISCSASHNAAGTRVGFVVSSGESIPVAPAAEATPSNFVTFN
jgi:hypothetical protein